MPISPKYSSLFTGTNAQNTTVFTWLSTKNIVSKSLDLAPMIHYLWLSKRLPNSALYLGPLQLGSETMHTDGSNVTFAVTKFDAKLKKGTPKTAFFSTSGALTSRAESGLLKRWAVAAGAAAGATAVAVDTFG